MSSLPPKFDVESALRGARLNRLVSFGPAESKSSSKVLIVPKRASSKPPSTFDTAEAQELLQSIVAREASFISPDSIELQSNVFLQPTTEPAQAKVPVTSSAGSPTVRLLNTHERISGHKPEQTWHRKEITKEPRVDSMTRLEAKVHRLADQVKRGKAVRGAAPHRSAAQPFDEYCETETTTPATSTPTVTSTELVKLQEALHQERLAQVKLNFELEAAKKEADIWRQKAEKNKAAKTELKGEVSELQGRLRAMEQQQFEAQIRQAAGSNTLPFFGMRESGINNAMDRSINPYEGPIEGSRSSGADPAYHARLAEMSRALEQAKAEIRHQQQAAQMADAHITQLNAELIDLRVAKEVAELSRQSAESLHGSLFKTHANSAAELVISRQQVDAARDELISKEAAFEERLSSCQAQLDAAEDRNREAARELECAKARNAESALQVEKMQRQQSRVTEESRSAFLKLQAALMSLRSLLDIPVFNNSELEATDPSPTSYRKSLSEVSGKQGLLSSGSIASIAVVDAAPISDGSASPASAPTNQDPVRWQAAISSEVTNLNDIVSALKVMRGKLVESEGQNEALAQQRDAALKAQQHAQMIVRDTIEEKVRITDLLTASKTRNEVLQKECDDLQEVLGREQAQARDLQQKLERLLSQTRTESLHVIAETAELQKQLAVHELEVTKFKQRLETTERECQGLHTENEDLRRLLEGVRERLADEIRVSSHLRTELQEVSGLRSSLQDRVSDMLAKLERATADFETTRAKLEDIQSENMILTSTNGELEDEIVNLKMLMMEHESTKQRLDGQIAEQKRMLEGLQKKVVELESRAAQQGAESTNSPMIPHFQESSLPPRLVSPKPSAQTALQTPAVTTPSITFPLAKVDKATSVTFPANSIVNAAAMKPLEVPATTGATMGILPPIQAPEESTILNLSKSVVGESTDTSTGKAHLGRTAAAHNLDLGIEAAPLPAKMTESQARPMLIFSEQPTVPKDILVTEVLQPTPKAPVYRDVELHIPEHDEDGPMVEPHSARSDELISVLDSYQAGVTKPTTSPLRTVPTSATSARFQAIEPRSLATLKPAPSPVSPFGDFITDHRPIVKSSKLFSQPVVSASKPSSQNAVTVITDELEELSLSAAPPAVEVVAGTLANAPSQVVQAELLRSPAEEETIQPSAATPSINDGAFYKRVVSFDQAAQRTDSPRVMSPQLRDVRDQVGAFRNPKQSLSSSLTRSKGVSEEAEKSDEEEVVTTVGPNSTVERNAVSSNAGNIAEPTITLTATPNPSLEPAQQKLGFRTFGAPQAPKDSDVMSANTMFRTPDKLGSDVRSSEKQKLDEAVRPASTGFSPTRVTPGIVPLHLEDFTSPISPLSGSVTASGANSARESNVAQQIKAKATADTSRGLGTRISAGGEPRIIVQPNIKTAWGSFTRQKAVTDDEPQQSDAAAAPSAAVPVTPVVASTSLLPTTATSPPAPPRALTITETQTMTSSSALVQELTTEDIGKLCAATHISDVVAVLAGAVCMLLGEKPSWKQAVALMLQPNFKERVAAVDPMQISIRNVQIIQNLIESKHIREFMSGPAAKCDPVANKAEYALVSWILNTCSVAVQSAERANMKLPLPVKEPKTPIRASTAPARTTEAAKKAPASPFQFSTPATGLVSPPPPPPPPPPSAPVDPAILTITALSEENPTLRAFVDTLLHGVAVQKVAANPSIISRSTHARTLYLEKRGRIDTLVWAKHGPPPPGDRRARAVTPSTEADADSSSFPLSDLAEVVSGLGTAVLQKRGKREKAHLYISLIANSRTLDLECDNEEQRNWMFSNWQEILNIVRANRSMFI